MAVDLDVEELLIMGVSDLIIRQAQGEWETRDIKIIPNMQHVEDLSKRFKSIEFRYIPRFYNELADALATLAAMLPYLGNVHIDLLEIQIRERHGYCNAVKVEPDIQPWYHDIKRFLKRKEYPKQANGDQKRTIRRLASSFFSSGEVLYKRTPNLNLLRCVDAKEAEKIMNEVHSGSDTLFQQVVQIARMLERVRNEERESKEAKSSRSSGGFSEFYSASSTDHGGGLGSRST
ncbi:uncharacterized protein LOC142168262 [Nicotiana tabacum]|uniref:Uncharacterized protein LOC142168262 n=1 Tax=Nicotiana tabacum TaxID=4097 RepID=A0AC58SJ97_TOBAC